MHCFLVSNFIYSDVTFHNFLVKIFRNHTGTILPRECSDIADVKTGVYDIYPDGVLPAVPVYCVVNEIKKWTVLFFFFLLNFCFIVVLRKYSP